MSKIRIYIVDDHEMVRTGLRTLLESTGKFEIIGEATRVVEAMEFLSENPTDVVLLDVRLPDGSGLELCHYLQTFPEPPKVLVLTSYADKDLILKAVSAGADGYLLKEVNSTALATAIEKVLTGESVLDPSITRIVVDALRVRETQKPQKSNPLSPQEMRVLAQVAEGKTNKEIAEILGLSAKTVKNYFSNILDKLELSRRSQAAAYYVQKYRQQ